MQSYKPKTKLIGFKLVLAYLLFFFCHENVGAQFYNNTLTYKYDTTVTPQTVIITGHISSPASLTIPDTIQGYSVTAIGKNAFSNYSQLTNITIPSSVTSIGDSAFSSCSALNALTIPIGVTSIGQYAFASCSSLNNVVIPSSVTSIGDGAFQYCYRLECAYFIGNAPASFGIGVFSGCTIQSPYFYIYYNSRATGFSTPTWYGYTAIKYDFIYNNLVCSYANTYKNLIAVIGHCGNPTSVNIPSTINGFPVISIGDIAFANCASLISINIPYGITSIGEDAFASCSKLTSVTIPSSVISIGLGAFAECSNLATVNLSRGLTTIGGSAFTDCNSLISINIPDSVTLIVPYAFSGCQKLASAFFQGNAPGYFDNSVFGGTASNFTIYFNPGSNGFTMPTWNGYPTVSSENTGESFLWHYDTSITPQIVVITGFINNPSSITIPSTINGYSVTTIGDGAFACCSSLWSVTVPPSVTSIGYRAFADCPLLISINIDPQNPSFSSIDGVLFNKSQTQLIQYPTGKSGTTYSVPSSVTSIGDTAFQCCSSLTCMTIPNGVTVIGDAAYQACSSLTSVTIPTSVTSIKANAFNYCTSLTSAYFEGNAPASLGDNALYTLAPNFTIYYTSNSTGFTTPTWNGYNTALLPLDAWRSTHFTTAELNDPTISGCTATPAHDGISNLMKYALNLDPKTPATSGLPVAAVQNGLMTLTYTQVKNAPDITYIPEISTDLVTWNSGASYLSTSQTTDNGTTLTVTVQSLLPLSSNPRQFIRLRVVAQ